MICGTGFCSWNPLTTVLWYTEMKILLIALSLFLAPFAFAGDYDLRDLDTIRDLIYKDIGVTVVPAEMACAPDTILVGINTVNVVLVCFPKKFPEEYYQRFCDALEPGSKAVKHAHGVLFCRRK